MADPLKPFPEDKSRPVKLTGEPVINWTPERSEWWVQSQRLGIQYHTGYGPVFCPPRNWE